MTARTPRTWKAGDPEPADYQSLHVKDCRASTWRWWAPGDFWLTDRNDRAHWGTLTRYLGPLTEVLPDPAETAEVSARGHRNGCQGCEHEEGAYPPCWTEEQIDEVFVLQQEALKKPIPPAQLSQDGPNTATPVSQDPETGSGELSDTEPMNLWWRRGEVYVGDPALGQVWFMSPIGYCDLPADATKLVPATDDAVPMRRRVGPWETVTEETDHA